MLDIWIRIFLTTVVIMAVFIAIAKNVPEAKDLNAPYSHLLASLFIFIGLAWIISAIGIIWTA